MEYTIRPPGRNNCAALNAMSDCNWNRLRPTFGVHERHNSRFFLVVAVPLHGASTTTPSTPGSGILPMCLPSCCMISMLLIPSLPRLDASRFSRPDDGSLASTTPFGIASDSCVALEPGAAQVSITRSPSCGSSTTGGNIETASCLVIRPVSCSKAMIFLASSLG